MHVDINDNPKLSYSLNGVVLQESEQDFIIIII